MKEELTTKMHSEFTISDETDKKHRAYAAIDAIIDETWSIDETLSIYRIDFDYLVKTNNSLPKNERAYLPKR